MKLFSTRRPGWLLFAFAIGAIGILLAGGLSYILYMPGKSYTGPLPPITPAEAQVRDRLTSHVQTLAGDIGERNIWRYQSLLAAADYIEHVFAQAGYRPLHERYESRGKPVYNIIAEKPGTPIREEIVLVGAHYDTVQGGPGANDNGSGIAALLELARLLADRELPWTLRFVAFVNEERPFAGSQEMGSVVDAQRAKERGDRIQAMIDLETIGYYSDTPGSQHYPFPLSWFYPSTGNFVGFVGNLASRKLVHSALRSFRRQTQFPAEGAAVPEWVKGVGWSDHSSFWQMGYPAIMVTDTAFFRYAHYHAASDTPDKLDYARTARVVVGLAHVLSDLASEPGKAD
jgi:hypothetical protein